MRDGNEGFEGSTVSNVLCRMYKYHCKLSLICALFFCRKAKFGNQINLDLNPEED